VATDATHSVTSSRHRAPMIPIVGAESTAAIDSASAVSAIHVATGALTIVTA
jgi:hypothetical protein